MLSKFIKMSTCILCLGTMISGLSTIAMEKNNNNDALGSGYVNTNGEQERESDEINFDECMDLIETYGLNEEKSEEAMDLFEDIVKKRREATKKNRTEDYAYEYVKLLLVDGVKDISIVEKVAELYEKLLADGKCELYSDEYARLIVIYKLSERQADEAANIYADKVERGRTDIKYADVYARSQVIYEIKEKSEMNKFMRSYKSKIKKGLSESYAGKYAELKVTEDLNDEEIDRIAKIYEREINSGKSVNYANRYVRALMFDRLNEPFARMMASSYETKLAERYSTAYARKYSSLQILYCGLSAIKADKIAQAYSEKVESDGKKYEYRNRKYEDYVDEYVELMINVKLDARRADIIAKDYAERVDKYKGKDDDDRKMYKMCEREYLMLTIVNMINETQANECMEIYRQKISERKSAEYAHEYSVLKVVYKFTDEQADRGAKIYEKDIWQDKSANYINKYLELSILHKLSEEIANRGAAMYEQCIERYGNVDLANECVKYKVFERMSNREAYEAIEIYKQKIDEGHGNSYAYKFARLRVFIDTFGSNVCMKAFDVSDEEMELYMTMIEDEVTAGRSALYAIEYLMFKYFSGLKESSARMYAEIFDQEIKSGKSIEYAREYTYLLIEFRLEESVARQRAEVFERNLSKGVQGARRFAEAVVSYGLDRKATNDVLTRRGYNAHQRMPYGYTYFSGTGYRKNYIGKEGRELYDTYQEKLKEGSYTYAREYVRILEQMANRAGSIDISKMARIYEIEVKKGRTALYAREYARLIVKNCLHEDIARRMAEEVEQSVKTATNANTEEEYRKLYSPGTLIQLCCLSMMQKNEMGIWKLEKSLTSYLERIGSEEFSGTKSKKKAELIASLKKTMRKSLSEGKDLAYAKEYARAKVICKLDERSAKRQAEICSMEVKSGESYIYASEYARLLVTCKENLTDAREQVAMFDRELESGKSECFARKLTELTLKEGIDAEAASKEALCFETELMHGSSEIYASEYAKLVTIYGVEGKSIEKKVRRMAEIIEKELDAGKSQIYAREYARLKVMTRRQESNARKIAERFEQLIGEGMSPEEARECAETYKKPPCKRTKRQ